MRRNGKKRNGNKERGTHECVPLPERLRDARDLAKGLVELGQGLDLRTAEVGDLLPVLGCLLDLGGVLVGIEVRDLRLVLGPGVGTRETDRVDGPPVLTDELLDDGDLLRSGLADAVK